MLGWGVIKPQAMAGGKKTLVTMVIPVSLNNYVAERVFGPGKILRRTMHDRKYCGKKLLKLVGRKTMS